MVNRPANEGPEALVIGALAVEGQRQHVRDVRRRDLERVERAAGGVLAVQRRVRQVSYHELGVKGAVARVLESGHVACGFLSYNGLVGVSGRFQYYVALLERLPVRSHTDR